ncbi:hypothetical protein [Streptomyces canus]|uniref:hypothetical protein n=1 Tax=Streptomyces canus TaxID=58343 RepID=UPI00324E0E63
MFHLLYAARRLRGSRLDVFGYHPVRRRNPRRPRSVEVGSAVLFVHALIPHDRRLGAPSVRHPSTVGGEEAEHAGGDHLGTSAGGIGTCP